MMKNWIIKHKRTFLGLLIGAVGGFLYWRLVGCSTGTCPITSSPYISTLYGAMFGAVLFYSSPKKKKSDDVE